jgi:adenine phosphoribosyltransferase
MKTVQDYIRTIPDFPHEGIMFRDVTTLFSDPRGFRLAIDQLLHPYVGMEIDRIVGLEARGFILGGPSRTSCPVVSCRSAKRGNCRARPSNRPTR